MRAGLLPFCRKWRKNHCEWQIQLMERGGPKGWAASPAFLFHLEPCWTSLLPPPRWVCSSGGFCMVFLSSFWAPLCPEQLLPLALHLSPCFPWSEETTAHLAWWDSALNPAHPQAAAPCPTHSPVPLKEFPSVPIAPEGCTVLLPAASDGTMPGQDTSCPSSAVLARERTGAVARSPPSHVPPGWGGSTEPLAPAGWLQPWLACAGAGVQTGLFPLPFPFHSALRCPGQ